MDGAIGSAPTVERRDETLTVEITAAIVKNGIVVISCIDCSEENLNRIMRNRDDGGFQRTFDIIIDTKEARGLNALRKWLKRQACTKGMKTWGDALHALCGTVTETYGIGGYIVWD